MLSLYILVQRRADFRQLDDFHITAKSGSLILPYFSTNGLKYFGRSALLVQATQDGFKMGKINIAFHQDVLEIP
jgi:hypothetical protein